MKKLVLPFLFASLLAAFSSSSFASEEPQSYGSKVGDKALNGFANMTTGILEIPKNIINTTNQSNIAYGVIGGLAKGIINTAGRIVTGAADLITAPLPTKPIVYPYYIWDDFDVDTSYEEVFRTDFNNDSEQVSPENTASY